MFGKKSNNPMTRFGQKGGSVRTSFGQKHVSKNTAHIDMYQNDSDDEDKIKVSDLEKNRPKDPHEYHKRHDPRNR